jgi:SAM-dependent methyltransferase
VRTFDMAERETWTGRAQAYANSFASLCAYPVPALLDAIRPATRLLDVGCGPGTVAKAATDMTVISVDAAPDMVALAAGTCVAALPELPFRNNEFDATTANFVLNHVASPRTALAELRRVTCPGGRVAVTIWATPAAEGQTLLGRAVQAAGVERPAHLPSLEAHEDFPRTEDGLATLLAEAGFAAATCRVLEWDHRTTVDEWWRGPAAGVATIGQIITSQPAEARARIRQHLESLCQPEPDGTLLLPHRALLAQGRA